MKENRINIMPVVKRIWFTLASSYTGLLVFWALAFIGGTFNQNWLNILFYEGAVFYGVAFILLPIIYWRFYLVFSWMINIVFLAFLALYMMRLGFIIENDPLYIENNERIWGPGFHFMHFILSGVTALFIYTLWKPALFHFRRFIKINRAKGD